MLKIVDANGRSVRHRSFDRSSAVALVGEGTDRFKVKGVDLGNGHVEALCSRVIAWQEADWPVHYLNDVIDAHQKFADENPEEVEVRNRDRAARRAKTRVRRLCKAMGATTLLTLTYRGLQDDLGLCKRHLKEFCRRVSRIIPNFRAVACFEEQKRGAWHVHMATCNVPTVLPCKAGGDFRSFNVLRAIWRSVTKEFEGNVDVKRRKHHSRKTAAAVAAYISKYIGKAFAESAIGDGVNRYAVFGKVDVPELVDLGVAESLCQALGMAFELLDVSHSCVSSVLDRWQEWYFLAAEKSKRS